VWQVAFLAKNQKFFGASEFCVLSTFREIIVTARLCFQLNEATPEGLFYS
jgi:hypothetical protein